MTTQILGNAKWDGTFTLMETTLDTEGNIPLKVLQDGVGGYIERVSLPLDMNLWCNEEGLLHGLPLNPFATTFASIAYGKFYPIHGNVVLTHNLPGGDDAGLNPEQIELCLKIHKRAQEIAAEMGGTP